MISPDLLREIDPKLKLILFEDLQRGPPAAADASKAHYSQAAIRHHFCREMRSAGNDVKSLLLFGQQHQPLWRA
jgi:hypothetical protein